MICEQYQQQQNCKFKTVDMTKMGRNVNKGGQMKTLITYTIKKSSATISRASRGFSTRTQDKLKEKENPLNGVFVHWDMQLCFYLHFCLLEACRQGNHPKEKGMCVLRHFK